MKELLQRMQSKYKYKLVSLESKISNLEEMKSERNDRRVEEACLRTESEIKSHFEAKLDK